MCHFIKAYFYILVVNLLKFSSCCDCDKKKTHTKNVPGGRESETQMGITTQVNIVEVTEDTNILNVTHVELKETEFKRIEINNHYTKANEMCSHLKNGTELNIEKMVDVWQIVYYQTPYELACFKIHIKKTTSEDRKLYAETYGNFHDRVNWDECYLELLKEKSNSTSRKHFLQGTSQDLGVLANVVISEENNTTTAILHEESPDQWMVIKNLLLMRDCENGNLVIFSRMPYEPRAKDIIDALEEFGEDIVNGTMACNDGYRIYNHMRSSEIEY